ncbi:MAG: hypothetical protein ACFFB0_02115 [Promethearchaeota archaeon]
MKIVKSLENLISKIDLEWIDNSNELTNSNYYHELMLLFPNLHKFFEEGQHEDEFEFFRTLRHILRTLKIYFLIKNNKFFHNTLSISSLQTIRKKVLCQTIRNELILPLILMYHDIGRFYDKENHPYQSYLLINDRELLEPYDISELDKLLISKIIQYHLLFATIYTGESTFYGIYSLINDNEFIKLVSNEKFGDIFIDILEIFTYIDILGYSYAVIYDHYIIYYNEINSKLKKLLSFWPDKVMILKKAIDYSQEWVEWRIAGALRIFQFINTQQYLTKDFFFKKIIASTREPIEEMKEELDWNIIKDKYLMNTWKIQIKYGLGILMLLTIGKFYRGPIEEDGKISNNLIIFWILLSKEIAERSIEDKEILWNVHFKGLPNWWKWDRKFKKELNYNSLNSIMKNSSQDFNIEKNEYNLYLDFDVIFN